MANTLRDWIGASNLTVGRITGRVSLEAALASVVRSQRVRVIRPEDLLVLDFGTVNFRRQAGRLVRSDPARPSYLIVHHQTQSFGEEAVPEISDSEQAALDADPKLKGRKPPANPAAPAPADNWRNQTRISAAGESRLVFEMPQEQDGIDWTLDSLLQACRSWPLWLDGSAQLDPDPFYSGAGIKYGWLARDLRASSQLARSAIGELGAETIADLDRFANDLTRRAVAGNGAEAGALGRLATDHIRRVLPGSAREGESRVDQVAAAIYIRAQASRRALLEIRRGRLTLEEAQSRLPPEIYIDFLRPDPPGADETAIEMPWRLFASPLKTGGFDHRLRPASRDVGARGARTELWHTQLGTRVFSFDGITVDTRPGTSERGDRWSGEKLRFIWSPDYRPPLAQPGPIDPFRKPLDATDRRMLVTLTADYAAKQQDNRTKFTPRAVFVRRLMMTAMGGDLEAHRKFDPRAQNCDLSAWTHRASLGRDYYVRAEYSGFLYPFGHRATLVKLTERKFQWSGNGADRVAYLRQRFFIVVRDREIAYPQAAPQPHRGRSLPFQRIICPLDQTPDLDVPGSRSAERLNDSFYASPEERRMAFWPVRGPGDDYRFPLIGIDSSGRKTPFEMPLLFVSELKNTSAAMPALRTHWNSSSSSARRTPSLDGAEVRMAPWSSEATDVDVPLMTAEFRAALPDGQLRETPQPSLQAFPIFGRAKARMAAMERLTGAPRTDDIEYYGKYLTDGLGEGGVFAKVVGASTFKFGGDAPSDKVGGVATPDFKPSGLSAKHGVVSGDVATAASDTFDPAQFFPDAKLLGVFALKDLLNTVLPGVVSAERPKITTERQSDRLVSRFEIVQDLGTNSPFDALILAAGGPTVFALATRVEAPFDGSPSTTEVTGELTHFKINLLNALILHFDRLRFYTLPGSKPDVDVDLNPETGVAFGGPLEFINRLKDFIPANGFSDPPNLDITPQGISAGYTLGLPNVQIGIMALSNIALGAAFSLPFTGGPPTARFNFAERHNTFNLTVALFGGGGFFALVADTDGIREIEAQLDFGAQIAIDLGVASGSVYVKGGFYFHYATDMVHFEGFVEIGGRLSVLGLITVSLTFHLGLNYELLQKSANNGVRASRLFGQATLTVEIEILFFSASVDVTVEKTFVGSSADPTVQQLLPNPRAWEEYCAAFA